MYYGQKHMWSLPTRYHRTQNKRKKTDAALKKLSWGFTYFEGNVSFMEQAQGPGHADLPKAKVGHPSVQSS